MPNVIFGINGLRLLTEDEWSSTVHATKEYTLHVENISSRTNMGGHFDAYKEKCDSFTHDHDAYWKCIVTSVQK